MKELFVIPIPTYIADIRAPTGGVILIETYRDLTFKLRCAQFTGASGAEHLVQSAWLHWCWCANANSHRVAKLQFAPHSSQLLLSHFLSLVDAMYGHRVPIFTTKFYGFVRVQYDCNMSTNNKRVNFFRERTHQCIPTGCDFIDLPFI